LPCYHRARSKTERLLAQHAFPRHTVPDTVGR
jgi:hypothetical protein